MKAALVVLAVVAVVAVCEAGVRTTTVSPCQRHCPLDYRPVCAQDPEGVYYLFPNLCTLRACSCRTNIEFNILDSPKRCPLCPRTKCPDQQSEGDVESSECGNAGSVSVDSSDSASGRWDRNEEIEKFT